MHYKTFDMTTPPLYRDAFPSRAYDVRCFLRALFLTLTAAGLAAGMLYVCGMARSYSEVRGAGDMLSGDTPLGDIASALWRVIGKASPYFSAAVGFFVMLCAFFALVARLLFG